MYDETFKLQVIEALKNRGDDVSIAQIAREHHVPLRTVYLWRDRYGLNPRGNQRTTERQCMKNGYLRDTDLQKKARELEEENIGLKRVIDILVKAIGKAHDQ